MTMQAKDLVAEFQHAFKMDRDPTLWVKLVAEETAELETAIINLLKEAADLSYVLAGLNNDVSAVGYEPTEEDRAVVARAMYVADVLDAITNNQDVAIDAAFDIVHQSNMSKLGEDGEPMKREDGKIIKGPNYQPAEPEIRKYFFGVE